LDPSPLVLGPFELIEPIGLGGMGEVWQARHGGHDRAVAVKVMTGAHAADPRYHAAFRAEVRAIVRLHHPGIITVYDYGQIPPEAERASAGRLAAHSPYLVMEVANRGTLKQIDGVDHWTDAVPLLSAILDALAHAHARGVIHRDIKPGNVLVTEVDGQLHLKLSDFGIAHALYDEQERQFAHVAHGTPQYMAPEQIMRQWRAQGPWTDLYAVGCLAHRLLGGRAPFQRPALGAILRAQLNDAPPPLPPEVEAPPALQRWVDRLLQKSPANRYQRAADAAWDLLQLTEAQERDPGGAGAWSCGAQPPVPASWRRPETGAVPLLRGAGVGLFGLRPVPLVGREAERDAIWGALGEVHREGWARAVVLEGGAGLGKTRLAEWAAERAHEVGAATVLRAAHSPTPGAASGIPRMLATAFRCVDADRDTTLACTRELLLELDPACDELEWLALTELLQPSDEAPEPDDAAVATPDDTLNGPLAASPRRVHFSSRAERHAVVQRLLERVARARPIVLLIDDAQWGADAVELVLLLLQSPTPLPVLALLTVQPNDARRTFEPGFVDALLQHPRATRVPIPPLREQPMHALLDGLLDLDGQLARQVVERVGGSPLFAIQVVGDWIERGALQAGPRGFTLRDGEALVIPDDIHAALSSQVNRLVTQLATHGLRRVRHALELAATLGPVSTLAEWEDACEGVGITLHPRMIEAALDRQLFRQDGAELTFAHGMIRECLVRTAREGDRWEAHNDACAEMLLRRAPHPASLPRLGQHLIAAGRHADALPVLLNAVRASHDASDYDAAHKLLDLREHALDALQRPAVDHDRVETLVARARTHILHGRLDATVAELDRLRQLHVPAAWAALTAEIAWLDGVVAQKRNRLDDAHACYATARDGYQACDDPVGVAHALYGLGVVCRLRGELRPSVAHIGAARELFAARADHTGVGQCLAALADVTRRKGDAERALKLIHRAVRSFRKAGNRFGIANSLNTLGDFARHRGDLDTAEDSYREAVRLCEAIGSGNAPIVRLNLGYILLLRARFEDARTLFTFALDELGRFGWELFVAYAHVGLVCCAAALDDFDAWDTHLPRAVALLEASHVIDDDIAWPLQLAADLARNAGHPRRALHAYQQALQQWQASDRLAEAHEVHEAIQAILDAAIP